MINIKNSIITNCTKYPKLVITISFLISLFFILGIPKIVQDDDMVRLLPDDLPSIKTFADISDELAAGTQSSTVYVSTDGQLTWQSAPATPLGTAGYETTWGGIINTNDGSSAYSYLSGLVNSEALGESFGTIIVSGTPHN